MLFRDVKVKSRLKGKELVAIATREVSGVGVCGNIDKSMHADVAHAVLSVARGNVRRFSCRAVVSVFCTVPRHEFVAVLAVPDRRDVPVQRQLVVSFVFPEDGKSSRKRL